MKLDCAKLIAIAILAKEAQAWYLLGFRSNSTPSVTGDQTAEQSLPKGTTGVETEVLVPEPEPEAHTRPTIQDVIIEATDATKVSEPKTEGEGLEPKREGEGLEPKTEDVTTNKVESKTDEIIAKTELEVPSETAVQSEPVTAPRSYSFFSYFYGGGSSQPASVSEPKTEAKGETQTEVTQEATQETKEEPKPKTKQREKAELPVTSSTPSASTSWFSFWPFWIGAKPTEAELQKAEEMVSSFIEVLASHVGIN